MKKGRNIIIVVLSIIIILIFMLFFFFKNKEVSYVNIKSVPEGCESYLLLNNNIIINQFSDYFLENPLDASKFYKFIKNRKLENFHNKIDININEPIACFYDDEVRCWNIIISVKNSTIEIENISSEFIKTDYKKINELNNFSLHVFNNRRYNQIVLLLGDINISEETVYEKTKNYFQNLDTAKSNVEALNILKKSKKSFVYKLKDFQFFKDLGIESLTGSIDLKFDAINLELSGSKNENFIFNNHYKLISNDFGWANFSANLSGKVLESESFSNLNIDSNFDGRCNLSVHQLKQTSNLNKLKNITSLADYIDFNLFTGNSNSVISKLINNDSCYKTIKEEGFDGYSISNFNKKYKLEYNEKGFFKLKIDFEKMINQQHSEWAWNGFKTVFKKMNMKALEIKCFSKNNSEFQLIGSVSSSDTTKNLLLSPFIY